MLISICLLGKFCLLYKIENLICINASLAQSLSPSRFQFKVTSRSLNLVKCFKSKFVVLPKGKATTVLGKIKVCSKKMPWKFLISSKPEVITSPIGS